MFWNLDKYVSWGRIIESLEGRVMFCLFYFLLGLSREKGDVRIRRIGLGNLSLDKFLVFFFGW